MQGLISKSSPALAHGAEVVSLESENSTKNTTVDMFNFRSVRDIKKNRNHTTCLGSTPELNEQRNLGKRHVSADTGERGRLVAKWLQFLIIN